MADLAPAYMLLTASVCMTTAAFSSISSGNGVARDMVKIDRTGHTELGRIREVSSTRAIIKSLLISSVRKYEWNPERIPESGGVGQVPRARQCAAVGGAG